MITPGHVERALKVAGKKGTTVRRVAETIADVGEPGFREIQVQCRMVMADLVRQKKAVALPREQRLKDPDPSGYALRAAPTFCLRD